MGILDEIIKTNRTLIENEFNKAFFDRRIKLNIGNKRNPSWVKRGISPYKMYLADFFRNQKLNHCPELLEELEKFRKLKNKVSAVITTNYDTFLLMISKSWSAVVSFVIVHIEMNQDVR